jgi:predicted nucleic acid-binding Zn ribbon protein
MHCENCGNKIETFDKFCTKCGHAVAQLKKNEKRTNLEQKAWYRAFKIVYILAVIIVLVIISIIAWSAKPERTIDGYKSTITCDNGASYAPSKNGIYIYGDTLTLSEESNIKVLCAYNSTDYYSHNGYLIGKNYTFNTVYEDTNSGSWFLYSVLAYLIALLVFKLIRISFFYIAIAEKPRWGEEYSKFFKQI